MSEIPDYPYKTHKPWLLQIKQFHFAKDKQAVLIPLKMRRGKSRVAVDIVTYRNHNLVLIMCPVSVMRVWPNQFRLHAMDDWQVVICDQRNVEKKMQEAQRAIDLAQIRGTKLAIVINHEAAWREPFASFALATNWGAVIVDESHRGKQYDGRFATFLHRFSSKKCQRLGLTGTPMAHSLLDLWSQYRFLDASIYGTSFYLFKARYCVTQERKIPQRDQSGTIMRDKDGNVMYKTFKEVVGFQNQDDFREKMLRIQLPMDEADDIETPATQHLPINIKMGEKAQKIYDELESKFYVEVEQGKITPANAMVRLLRLQQLTSGYLMVDGADAPTHISSHKEDALYDMLLDLNEPAIVVCRFTEDLAAVRRVAEKLKRKYGEVSGARKDLTENSTMPDWCDIMGVQIQSGGLGIDLTRAAIGFVFSTGFNLTDYLQVMARLDGSNQMRKVSWYHLITENTIDPRVYHTLEDRADVIDSIIKGRKHAA